MVSIFGDVWVMFLTGGATTLTFHSWVKRSELKFFKGKTPPVDVQIRRATSSSQPVNLPSAHP